MTLTTIVGDVGDGKTLFMTIMSAISNTSLTVSNYHLKNYPHKTELLDIGKFVNAEYDNCNILLDECYAYLESRISNSTLNLLMSYILFQSRKKSVNLYTTSQLFNTIDKRFRLLSDFVVDCKCIFHYEYDESTKTDKKIIEKFVYTIIKTKTNQIKIFELLFSTALEFFNMYDTLELIESEHMKNAKMQFITKSDQSKLVNELFDNVIDEYEDNPKALTQNELKLYIFENNIKFPNNLFTMLWAKIQKYKKNREKED